MRCWIMRKRKYDVVSCFAKVQRKRLLSSRDPCIAYYFLHTKTGHANLCVHSFYSTQRHVPTTGAKTWRSECETVVWLRKPVSAHLENQSSRRCGRVVAEWASLIVTCRWIPIGCLPMLCVGCNIWCRNLCTVCFRKTV